MSIYYSGVKQYSWIVLLSTLIAIIAAFFLAKSQVAMTQASSIIFVDANSPNSSIVPLGGSSSGIGKNADYAALLTSRSVFEFVSQSDPQIGKNGYTLDYLSKHVSVSPSANTSTITITVTAPNIGDAVMLANDLANGFESYIQIQYQEQLNLLRSDLQKRLVTYQQQKNAAIVGSLQSRLSALPLSIQSDVQVIQVATPTDVGPINKNVLVIAAATGAGLLLGIVLMLLMIFLDNRLRSEEQVKEKLELAYLGNISNSRQIVADRTHITGSIKQELTNIWVNLHLAGVLTDQRRTPGGPVLLVTSAQNAEGKTTVAAALAKVAVQDGSSVVVIDSNLHQPSTHLAFGMSNAGLGLNGLLRSTGGGIVDAAVQRSSIPGLWLLPAGVPADNSTFLLKRELPGILAQLREKVDLIIIDASPLLSSAEASLIATMADGVIFVVDSRHGKVPLLLRAKEVLTSLSHKPIGVVLNHFSGRRSSPYYVATLYPSNVTTEMRTDAEAYLNKKQKPAPTHRSYDTGGDASYTLPPSITQSNVSRFFNSTVLK